MTRFFALGTFVLVLVSSSSANTLFVSKQGDGTDGLTWETAFNRVSDALSTMNDGVEIWVASGTYHESLRVFSRTGISFYGGFRGDETVQNDRDWTSNRTVLSASGYGMAISLALDTDEITIDGFTITNGKVDRGGGVYFGDVDSATLTNCTIVGNTAHFGGGVYCWRCSPKITHCAILGNTADVGGGVYCIERSSPTLTNCILWNPGSEVQAKSGNPVVTYCCVQGGYPGEGNVSANPLFLDPTNQDGQFMDLSPCIDAGVDLGLPYNGAAPDMGPWESPGTYTGGSPEHIPALLHVRADASSGGDGRSWGTAFASIGEALGLSSVSDEIWIAGGTYHEAVRMEPTVCVRGGFAGDETDVSQKNGSFHTTIVDATGLNDRPLTAGGTEDLFVEGFTLTNGRADDQGGGGIYIGEVDSATFINCSVLGNTATGRGGGVLCTRSSPVMDSCTIAGNETLAASDTLTWGGGVACGEFAAPTLVRCTISGNISNGNGGGVLCISQSSPAFLDCTIEDNTADYQGGGLYCSSGSIALTNCLIRANMANERGGGISYTSSAPSTLTNCIIAENTANEAGGAYSTSPLSLMNCTLTENEADQCGGLVFGRRPIALINSIFWNNSPPELASIDEGVPNVQYCLVENGWLGEGNIDDDPLFLDPENGDFRLQQSSPCIDSASRSGPTIDFRNVIRPFDIPNVGRDGPTAYDMGAYEMRLPIGDPRSDMYADGSVDARDLLFLLEDMANSEETLDLLVFQEDWMRVTGG